jgi:hypothetical protein
MATDANHRAHVSGWMDVVRRLLLALLFSAIGVSAHAGTDLTGSWSWTDISNTTGESFSGNAQIVGGANGTFTWNWVSGWTGTGTVSGSNWTLSGSSTAFTATWTGTIAQSGSSVTLQGTWKQSDGQVGTTTATGTISGNHLAFSVQPPNGNPSKPLAPVVAVQVLNSQNQVVAGASDAITLSLQSNPGNATLLGATSNAVGGVATFPALAVSQAGQQYTLLATDADSSVGSATSTAFNIVACNSGQAAASFCLTKDGNVDATGDLSYTLTLQNFTASTLTGIKLVDLVTPAFNLQKPAAHIGSPDQSDKIAWTDRATACTSASVCTQATSVAIDWSNEIQPLAAGASLAITYDLTADTVTAKNGARISVKTWQSDGWVATSQATPSIVRGGGQLVFSDQPEWLGADANGLFTEDAAGHTLGPDLEGVLYKQDIDQTTLLPLQSSGSFRIYMNHENRTAVAKQLYYLLTNPGPAAVTVTPGSIGLAQSAGNPVAAGQAALTQYLNHGASPAPKAVGACSAGTGTSTSIPANQTCAFLVNAMPASSGNPHVVNLIEDLTTSGPVQVGVVVVNKATAAAFEKNPLTYEFQGLAGSTTRTYLTDEGLKNPVETHVHGTFPYNAVIVNIPYDVGTGNRYGWRLGDNQATLGATAFALEYDAALDVTVNKVYNIGNFGVNYAITVQPSNAQSGMATQVLLNPRSAGPQPGGFTNAVAGVVTTSATTVPFAVPATGFVKDPTEAVGVGYIIGDDTFTLNFIPPAGDALPIAVVLGPAYVQNTAAANATGVAATQAQKILTLPDPNAGN